jgi:hypothetical protein
LSWIAQTADPEDTPTPLHGRCRSTSPSEISFEKISADQLFLDYPVFSDVLRYQAITKYELISIQIRSASTDSDEAEAMTEG